MNSYFKPYNYGLWWSGYHRMKWTERHEFITWTRLLAFPIELKLFGKVGIQLFSL